MDKTGSDPTPPDVRAVMEAKRPKTPKPNVPAPFLDFDEFWKAYPNKVGKDAARKAWEKRKHDLPPIEELLRVLKEQKRSDKWTKAGGEYITNPTTWINQGRWKDEINPVVYDPHNIPFDQWGPDRQRAHLETFATKAGPIPAPPTPTPGPPTRTQGRDTEATPPGRGHPAASRPAPRLVGLGDRRDVRRQGRTAPTHRDQRRKIGATAGRPERGAQVPTQRPRRPACHHKASAGRSGRPHQGEAEATSYGLCRT